MKSDFLERFRDFGASEHLWKPGQKILTAVSGGPDSLALLLAFHEVAAAENLTLGCCVVNHKIRKEAAEEAEFVSAVCRDLEIPCYAETVDVPAFRKAHGGSLETVARNLRYESLRRVMKDFGYDAIATAHHRGDQAETVLYRLLRGTGIRGLSGILPVSGDVIHPFLCFTKREIAEFLQIFPYTPCHDASNDVPDTARNRIRLELLPLLTAYNPAIEESLWRLSQSCRADEAFLDEAADAYFSDSELTDAGIRMKKEIFPRIPEALWYRVIRKIWLAAGGRVPEAEEARRIKIFLQSAATGKITSAAGVLVKAERHSFLFHAGDTRHYQIK